MRIRLAKLMMVAMIFLTFCSISSACELGKGQPYRPAAGYVFTTDSYILDRAPDRIGVTCISNLSTEPISAHWFIPTASGWVPPNEVFPKERYLKAQGESRIRGCLEYGNLGETVEADFVGDQQELEASFEERQIGCKNARNKYHSVAFTSEGKIHPIKINLRYFFPYEVNRASETMVKLEGTVTIEPVEGNTFSLTFNFGIAKYGDSEGKYDGKFTAIPVFTGGAKSLEEEFVKTVGKEYPLEKLGSSKFILSAGLKNFRIEEAFLDIMIPEGVQVARIGFPVYVGDI